MSPVLFIVKIVFFLYIATILKTVISQRKVFPLYLVVIGLAVMIKVVAVQITGPGAFYCTRFNFLSPVYYVFENLFALVIAASVISQSESSSQTRRYLIVHGIIFFFFFLIGFVVLDLLFRTGVLKITIQYEISGSVEVIRFTEAYKHLNKNYILINMIDLSFTLFWIFNPIHILFHYVYSIISLRGRREELREKDIVLDRDRALLYVLVLIGLTGAVPASAAFNISTLVILVLLVFIRARLGSYFKYEHEAYEENRELKKQLIDSFRTDFLGKQKHEYLERLVVLAAEVTDAASSGVYRIDEGGRLQPEAFSGPFPPLFPIDETLLRGTRSLSMITHHVSGTPVSAAGTFLENLMEDKSELLVKDALHDPSVLQFAHRLLNIETLIAVAFSRLGERFILLTMNSRDGEPFTTDRLDLLRSLTET